MTANFCGDYSDSPLVSKYYPIMRRLGYPQLDIKHWDDGEWAVIEYLNPPMVPSLTKWKYVLTGLKNVPISETFLKMEIRKIDPQFPEFWIMHLEKEMQNEKKAEDKEKDEEDRASQMLQVLLKNEDLKERVAKYGVRELEPNVIAARIAQHSPSKARALGIRIIE